MCQYVFLKWGAFFMANADIRKFAKDSGVYLWRVAEKYGITDTHFSRRLRHELPKAEKARIIRIIEELKAEAEVESA